MTKIKEIQTGKCKLLAVMVPKGASEFSLPTGSKLLCYDNKSTGCMDYIRLPSTPWTPLDISTELTEEEWRELMPYRNDYALSRLYPDYLDDECFRLRTAKESGLSLLEANQCYSVNPYPDPELTMRQGDGYVYYGASDEDFEIYKQAESNTGKWLMLKQLS